MSAMFCSVKCIKRTNAAGTGFLGGTQMKGRVNHRTIRLTHWLRETEAILDVQRWEALLEWSGKHTLLTEECQYGRK